MMPRLVEKAADEQPDAARLFTVQDAAKYLQSIGATTVTVNFVRGLISSGQVAHLRMGKRFYISRTAIDSWLQSHERRMK
jgi:excisionase family DNA binding protein